MDSLEWVRRSFPPIQDGKTMRKINLIVCKMISSLVPQMWAKTKPLGRIELPTPGLQDQCSNHWATEALGKGPRIRFVYIPTRTGGFRRPWTMQVHMGAQLPKSPIISTRIHIQVNPGLNAVVPHHFLTISQQWNPTAHHLYYILCQ